ncbi:MAG: YCF48-related protein [Pyrinomonadaceae bacterium]
MILLSKITRSLFFLCFAFVTAGAQATDDPATAMRSRRTAAEASAADWRVIGPVGGDVRALVVDPSNPKHFYLGTLDGQMYTSNDGGASWSRIPSFNYPTLYIDHIIVDPRASKTLYVGAHRHKNPGGFFKTTDGGQTWTQAKDLKGEALHSLTQSSKTPDILVAGTNTGIFRSQDAGESWERLPTATTQGLINVESLAIDPRDPNVIYAGTWYLPYKSSDGGQTWKIIKNGMIDDSDVFAIDIDPRNPDHVIASACSGIYDSRDAGETWRKVQGIPSQSRRTRAILQHPTVSGIVFAGTTEGFWTSSNGGSSWINTSSRQLEINSIAVHPQNPESVYIGTNNHGVMVSHDMGKTFAQSNSGFSARRAYFLLADRERPNRLYATTINTATGGGFFYVSDDAGETWRESMKNMPSRLICYSVLQDRRDANLLYAATSMGLYRSPDRGSSWEAIGAPKQPKTKKNPSAAEVIEQEAAATAASDSNREVVKFAQEVLVATGFDAGAPDGVAGPRTIAALRQFQAAKKLPQSGKIDNPTLAALGLAGGNQLPAAALAALNAPIALTETINDIQHTYDDKDGQPGLFAATAAGLYRSYDPHKGWEKINFGDGYDARMLSVAAAPQDPKTIWAGTASSGLLVSRDRGESWQQVNDVPSKAPVNTVKIDARRPSHVYVGTGWSLYLTHDNGQTWARRGGNLPYGNYTAILVNPENGDEVFTGSAYENDGGVFRSRDAGMTWQRVDPELPSRRAWTLAFGLGSTSKVFVGSHSAGIYVVEGVADNSGTTSSVVSK